MASVQDGAAGDGRVDFFVSYTHVDKAWAEWIAWVVEEGDRYKALVQAWDFPPGTNWVKGMNDAIQRATRTIAVLSPAYLNSVYGEAEWQAAWHADPGGAGRKLLTVRVEACDRPGLLGTVVGIDLFGIGEQTARDALNAMMKAALKGRAKPGVQPRFPGMGQSRPLFPGNVKPEGEAEAHGAAEHEEDATVTNLSDFRHRSAGDSAAAPPVETLERLIEEFSRAAWLISSNYRACSLGYGWDRPEVHDRLAQVESAIGQADGWLGLVGLADDIRTFDLRHSLGAYAGRAGEFVRALSGLEPSPASARRASPLDRYERSLRSLEDLLSQLHGQLTAIRPVPGSPGLR
jgi:TIR domain